MRKLLVIAIGVFLLNSCQEKNKEIDILKSTDKDFTQYVNPFIGTSKMGHVFPGATAPFGMVQLSPQTNFEVMFNKDGGYNNETYEYCAGYPYRGLDQNIHTSDGFTNYTVFSLWDTYRALHPLFNITQPERNNDMIKSMIAHHDESVHNMLPVWSHYANENWCMIGYHATSVIADAMAKNVGDFNHESALQASVNTANVRYFDGIGDYIDYKYVPDDKSHSSVSKTLEYAYNDWCIAKMAKQVGNSEIEKENNIKAVSVKRNAGDQKTATIYTRNRYYSKNKIVKIE